MCAQHMFHIAARKQNSKWHQRLCLINTLTLSLTCARDQRAYNHFNFTENFLRTKPIQFHHRRISISISERSSHVSKKGLKTIKNLRRILYYFCFVYELNFDASIISATVRPSAFVYLTSLKKNRLHNDVPMNPKKITAYTHLFMIWARFIS